MNIRVLANVFRTRDRNAYVRSVCCWLLVLSYMRSMKHSRICCFAFDYKEHDFRLYCLRSAFSPKSTI
jgi:hypothetical protein